MTQGHLAEVIRLREALESIAGAPMELPSIYLRTMARMALYPDLRGLLNPDGTRKADGE